MTPRTKIKTTAKTATKRAARTAKTAPPAPELDPVLDGVSTPYDVDPGEDLAVVTNTISGRSAILPRSVARLSGPVVTTLSDLQEHVVAMHEAQAHLEDLVRFARAQGASWGAIGWSIGVTPQAASKRFGEGD